MLKNLVFTICFVIISANTFADNNPDKPVSAESHTLKMNGIVTDRLTGEALTGVKVRIESTRQEVFTGFDGKFEFKNLTPGNYTITFNMVTYEGVILENIKIDTDSKENKIELKLLPVSEKTPQKSDIPVQSLFASNIG